MQYKIAVYIDTKVLDQCSCAKNIIVGGVCWFYHEFEDREEGAIIHLNSAIILHLLWYISGLENQRFMLWYYHRSAFLPCFNPNLGFLQAVTVTKSGHHLLRDRTSKGYGSILGLTSQTSLHACLQRLHTMQRSLWHQPRNRPMPLTCSVVQQMMARFRNFYSL